MKEFSYRVSMIVPVYNVEEYLRGCLDSLVKQTINPMEMEVLLINDGSPDNSPAICREYVQKYPNFKLFSKENEGLSATRNYGIARAQGRYLMYLDSDDKLTPETVKSVADFFDEHYHEVDLVTYRDQSYRNGAKEKPHFRYQYMKQSGVYDLEDFPYITQTRINIAVKNMGEDNHLYDTTPNFRHEDQEYNNEIVKRKMKIGYCAQGEYCYNRDNDTSIMATYIHAYHIFETSVSYYEKLFYSFEGKVPRYFQGMLMHDLNWKLARDCLYPYHYQGEDFRVAFQRLVNLINCIEPEVIIKHPTVNIYHKFYWLSLKENCTRMIYAEPGRVTALVDGQAFYTREGMETILHRVRVLGSQIRLLAFIKMPIYNFLKEPAEVYAVENGGEAGETRRKLETFLSVHSHYGTKTQTNFFYAFEYTGDADRVRSLRFEVDLDGFSIPAGFSWFMPYSGFTNSDWRRQLIRDHVQILFEEDCFYFTPIAPGLKEAQLRRENRRYKAPKPKVARLRDQALDYRRDHRVWLYYDLYTVRKDNGYYQFVHDFAQEDGVERYYVYNRPLEEIQDLFTEEQLEYLVPFGSDKHRLLFLAAEKVLTAFFGFSPVCPWTEQEFNDYIDIVETQTIYLQHGVLHADLRLINAAERGKTDKIVVSSHFELENLVKNYNYRPEDLIPSGMARYDHMDRERKPERKILFAPSWRSYFTATKAFSVWELQSRQFLQSDYYQAFNGFLQSPELAGLLEQHDMELHFKPHPIIAESSGLFQVDNPRIRVVSGDVREEDYSVFITDFSSYVFDFVYLERALFYFVPDLDQFRSGMNNYRRLDLPFEQGFGDLALTAKTALAALERILEDGCRPREPYARRMAEFFTGKGGHCDGLYNALTQGEKQD